MFVHPDAQADSSGRPDSVKIIGRIVGKTFSIGKYNCPQEAIVCNPKPVFGLQVKHVQPPEPALYITPTRIVVLVPACAGQVQIRGVTRGCQPVITPDGQYIIAPCRNPNIFSDINGQGLPVLV